MKSKHELVQECIASGEHLVRVAKKFGISTNQVIRYTFTPVKAKHSTVPADSGDK